MIAVDAMGGDFAPDVVVKGALSCAKTAQIPICLFGPEDEVVRQLDALDSQWSSYPLKISHAPDTVTMGQDPVSAVRSLPNSSLVKAVASVKTGTSTAALSAGNSGAMMAAAIFLIGRNKGVERPALVSFLPGKSGPVVALDLGANADCKASQLYQFAHLGAAYAKDMLKIKKPSIGLLSNGQESTKGSRLTKEAFALLQKSSLHFTGNIEPEHVFANKVDVVVCDGFAGNVLLKTFEATVVFCGVPKEKQEQLKPGGALLLGVKKPIIVVHGNASVLDIEKAITFAHTCVSTMTVETYSITE